MKNGKKWLTIVLALAMTTMPAYGYTRTQSILYDEAKLNFNNEDKTTVAEPIIIDGITYLPLRAMSNLLGLNIGWNQESKTVSLNAALNNDSNLQAELQAKNYEITMLRQELETLRNKTNTSTTNTNTTNNTITTTTTNNTTTSTTTNSNSYNKTYGTDILGTEITATRRMLDDDYSDYFSNLDFDFYVSLSGSRLKILVSVVGTADNREFRRLSNSQIKNFIEDVCEAVRDRHDDIVISGEIENDDTGKTLYTFSYSKSDRLTYSSDSSSSYSYSSDSSYYDDDVRRDLERIVNNAGRVYIDDYDSSIGIDKFYVTEMSSSTIYASMYLDISSSDRAKNAWNINAGYENNSDLKRYLINFSEDLRENYNIIYTIYDYRTGTNVGTYNYDSNRINLNTIS